MSSLRVEFFAILAVYFFIGSVIAFTSRRYFTKDIRDYYTASGRLGGIISAGTYAATTYSTFMMVGLVGLSYATGVGALGFELLYLVATVFFLSTVGLKIWSMSKQRKWISSSQMIGELYNSRAISKIVALIYLFAMIPYLAAQLQGLSALFRYGGLDRASSIFISTCLTYLWIIVAGMWSVALTDLYQGILSLAGGFLYLTSVLAYLGTTSGANYGILLEILGDNGYLGLGEFWKPHVFLAYTTPWVFFALTNPQVVIRLYLPKDESSYRKMGVLFSVYGYIYTCIAVIVGLIAAGLALSGVVPLGLKWDDVTPYLLSLFNPLVASIVAVSIIAAGVSTANSIVLAVSSSVVKDVLLKEKLMVARLVDTLLVVIASIIAMQNIGFIVELSVLTSVILLPLAPATILGIYREKLIGKYTRLSCPLSIIAGASVGVLYSLTYGPRSAFTQPVLGAPISIYVLGISSLMLISGYALDRFMK
ncbi:MAG: sodium:solute symporter family protein [Desulfurococcaceae archaeon]